MSMNVDHKCFNKCFRVNFLLHSKQPDCLGTPHSNIKCSFSNRFSAFSVVFPHAVDLWAQDRIWLKLSVQSGCPIQNGNCYRRKH